MLQTTNLGYPRIGRQRELKKALEQFWSGQINEQELLARAAALRQRHWLLQQELGLHHIPSNDFSLYDHVLDTIALVGAIPERYHWDHQSVPLSLYFVMARGMVHDQQQEAALPAMEMTKWFDTNYHYIVPEFHAQQTFRLASTKPLDEFLEAKRLGIHTRPVLLGPISFLLLGKMHPQGSGTLSLLTYLLPVYEDLLQKLAAAGADWIQIDEPCLSLDLDETTIAYFQQVYSRLSAVSPSLKLLLATYFGDLGAHTSAILHLPVAAVHLDLVRAPQQLALALEEAPASLSLSLGIIDGRNVWRADLDRALELIRQATEKVGSERILLAPSCSLLHVPVDLAQEKHLHSELQQWLAFAQQKIEEVVLLSKLYQQTDPASLEQLLRTRQALEQRRTSPMIHDSHVKQRVASVRDQDVHRQSPFAVRQARQQQVLGLPLLPTTTIGSFPQTESVRAARAAYISGRLEETDYEAFLREEITRTIRFQEELGIDVLVHGECERTDMVEYFGKLLEGFAFTQHGWVQSYGSRCVRPPILYGDVKRPTPMTVRWSTFAQSQTKRPVKGMLTGPVTLLQWSFVRDDQPRQDTCYQLALALREEVQDLEAAGIRMIQIDEPALREGLPLRRSEWDAYLAWAVNCFRVASSHVRDETQIHTHMCYAEFGDIFDAIARMDADVLSIEASRSHLELLETSQLSYYPNAIGPGIYDIHSPRIPSQEECEQNLECLLAALSVQQLWVNPDCGLKTRRWEEVQPSLRHMVAAAQAVRQRRQQDQ